MDKLITNIEDLPEQQQSRIKKRLQELNQKAMLLLDQMPDDFDNYIEKALKECNDTMREMIEKSTDEYNDKWALSFIYVLHKERKNDLVRLKEKVLDVQQQPQNLSPEPKHIPKELMTEEAKKVLQRGITAGLLNNEYQPEKGVTRYQQKEFADLASDVLKIQNKWVVFGSLWNVNNLGQVKTSDADPESLKAVRRLFPDMGYDSKGLPQNRKEKFHC